MVLTRNSTHLIFLRKASSADPQVCYPTIKIYLFKFLFVDRDYAHVVLRSIDGSDLFNLDSLLILCRIEQELIQTQYYTDLCVRKAGQEKCCRPWSLANYVALIQNRTSCLALTVRKSDLEELFYFKKFISSSGRGCECN